MDTVFEKSKAKRISYLLYIESLANSPTTSDCVLEIQKEILDIEKSEAPRKACAAVAHLTIAGFSLWKIDFLRISRLQVKNNRSLDRSALTDFSKFRDGFETSILIYSVKKISQ